MNHKENNHAIIINITKCNGKIKSDDKIQCIDNSILSLI